MDVEGQETATEGQEPVPESKGGTNETRAEVEKLLADAFKGEDEGEEGEASKESAKEGATAHKDGKANQRLSKGYEQLLERERTLFQREQSIKAAESRIEAAKAIDLALEDGDTEALYRALGSYQSAGGKRLDLQDLWGKHLEQIGLADPQPVDPIEELKKELSAVKQALKERDTMTAKEREAEGYRQDINYAKSVLTEIKDATPLVAIEAEENPGIYEEVVRACYTYWQQNGQQPDVKEMFKTLEDTLTAREKRKIERYKERGVLGLAAEKKAEAKKEGFRLSNNIAPDKVEHGKRPTTRDERYKAFSEALQHAWKDE